MGLPALLLLTSLLFAFSITLLCVTQAHTFGVRCIRHDRAGAGFLYINET